jgi:hypothetical protein
MPLHDWTTVDAGSFHAFHHCWITMLTGVLKGGILPKGYYALPEQILGAFGPDVLTLQRPERPSFDSGNGTATAVARPKTSIIERINPFKAKSPKKQAVIRHVSDHRIVAVVEAVSPGNKSSDEAIRTFREKAILALQQGIHLMILDLFPPTKRDPHGVHALLAEECGDDPLPLPPGKDRVLASYCAEYPATAYIECVAVGDPLPDLPIFLKPELHVPVALERAYSEAVALVPEFWFDPSA